MLGRQIFVVAVAACSVTVSLGNQIYCFCWPVDLVGRLRSTGRDKASVCVHLVTIFAANRSPALNM